MSVSLSHSCTHHAITDDSGPNGEHTQQIICELYNDLRALSEHAPPEQDFERFEREVHQRFLAAERAVLAGELQRLLMWTCLPSRSAPAATGVCCGPLRPT